MINRRFIRIRVMQTFYSYQLQALDSIEKAERQLIESFDKTYDLYFYLLQLIIEISDYAKWKIQQGKQKLLPTYEDLHPNTKFADNQLVVQLRENLHLQEAYRRMPYNWSDESDKELIKNLYEQFKNTKQFKKYMDDPQRSYSQDKDIIIYLVREIFYNSEDLYDNLEEKNIFWADVADYVVVMIVKTLQKFSIGDDMRRPLMPKFRNPEDFAFAKDLLLKSILRKKQYLQILEDHIVNWDITRLAQIDIILLVLALHELLYIEDIPVKVTLDEYIEISKYFSTPKSPAFINGILDKITKKLKQENLIVKSGKGLIES